MKKDQPNSVKVRGLLLFVIVLIIGLSVFGFYTAKSKLNDYAISVGELVNQSSLINGSGLDNTKAAKEISELLVSSQVSINKASLITASAQDYQTQITADVNKYADITGLTISDYNFDKPSGSDSGASSGSNYITITFSGSINFESLLKFIKYTEHNLPKMQLTGINMTKDTSKNDAVNIKPLVFKVYTK